MEGCGIRDELIAEAVEALACKADLSGSSPAATSIFSKSPVWSSVQPDSYDDCSLPVHPSRIEMCSSLRKLFRRLLMADIEGIDAQQAHAKAESNQALLVCAYEDEAKCRRLNLDGSISFASFKSWVNSLPKSQEIIFY